MTIFMKSKKSNSSEYYMQAIINLEFNFENKTSHDKRALSGFISSLFQTPKSSEKVSKGPFSN